MVRTACLASVCILTLLPELRAQEVMIAREAKPKYPKAEAVSGADVPAVSQPVAKQATSQPILPLAAQPTITKKAPTTQLASSSARAVNPRAAVKLKTSDPVPLQTTAVPTRLAAHSPSMKVSEAKTQKKTAAVTAESSVRSAAEAPEATVPKASVSAPAVKIASNETTPKAEPAASKPATAPAVKPTQSTLPISTQLSPLTKPAKAQVASNTHEPAIPASKVSSPAKPLKLEPIAPATAKTETSSSAHFSDRRISLAAAPQPVSFNGDSAFVRLADGFDFPVGKPEAQGYYKARGFRSHGHLGEDWDGVGGGDTDLGDPIYVIGNGVVVFARDCHMGWGNVIIVRHSYRENGTVKTIDSLYGHLNSILVKRGQSVLRGQQIATLGNAHGLYDAHLHLEIRKNLEIGMSRASFARDFSNYYDPSQFIMAHRRLQTSGGTYRVAMNTFTHDARINWDNARNFSHAHTGGGTDESAVALKKALAQKK